VGLDALDGLTRCVEGGGRLKLSRWNFSGPAPRSAALAISPPAVVADGPMSTACWHVVRAIGRSDEAVSRLLVNVGFTVYCPRILELRPLAKRQLSAAQRRAGIAICRPQLVPLFPRYLFVRFDMGRAGWREVFSIAGVGGLRP
jgi:Transcription termination factor nusG